MLKKFWKMENSEDNGEKNDEERNNWTFGKYINLSFGYVYRMLHFFL